MDTDSNSLNSTECRRWVGEIIASYDRSRELREDAAAQIAPDLEFEAEHRSGLYERAKAAGMPLAALKLEVARLRDDAANARKKAAREANAGKDIVDLADQIKELLGDFADTGLGAAAVKRAESGPKSKPKRGKSANRVDVDISPEARAAALKDGEDEPDVRGKRQLEKEALRKADAEKNLAAMKATEPTGVH